MQRATRRMVQRASFRLLGAPTKSIRLISTTLPTKKSLFVHIQNVQDLKRSIENKKQKEEDEIKLYRQKQALESKSLIDKHLEDCRSSLSDKLVQATIHLCTHASYRNVYLDVSTRRYPHLYYFNDFYPKGWQYHLDIPEATRVCFEKEYFLCEQQSAAGAEYLMYTMVLRTNMFKSEFVKAIGCAKKFEDALKMTGISEAEIQERVAKFANVLKTIY